MANEINIFSYNHKNELTDEYNHQFNKYGQVGYVDLYSLMIGRLSEERPLHEAKDSLEGTGIMDIYDYNIINKPFMLGSSKLVDTAIYVLFDCIEPKIKVRVYDANILELENLYLYLTQIFKKVKISFIYRGRETEVKELSTIGTVVSLIDKEIGDKYLFSTETPMPFADSTGGVKVFDYIEEVKIHFKKIKEKEIMFILHGDKQVEISQRSWDETKNILLDKEIGMDISKDACSVGVKTTIKKDGSNLSIEKIEKHDVVAALSLKPPETISYALSLNERGINVKGGNDFYDIFVGSEAREIELAFELHNKTTFHSNPRLIHELLIVRLNGENGIVLITIEPGMLLQELKVMLKNKEDVKTLDFFYRGHSICVVDASKVMSVSKWIDDIDVKLRNKVIISTFLSSEAYDENSKVSILEPSYKEIISIYNNRFRSEKIVYLIMGPDDFIEIKKGEDVDYTIKLFLHKYYGVPRRTSVQNLVPKLHIKSEKIKKTLEQFLENIDVSSASINRASNNNILVVRIVIRFASKTVRFLISEGNNGLYMSDNEHKREKRENDRAFSKENVLEYIITKMQIGEKK